jgi:hypothetical protein
MTAASDGRILERIPRNPGWPPLPFLPQGFLDWLMLT